LWSGIKVLLVWLFRKQLLLVFHSRELSVQLLSLHGLLGVSLLLLDIALGEHKLLLLLNLLLLLFLYKLKLLSLLLLLSQILHKVMIRLGNTLVILMRRLMLLNSWFLNGSKSNFWHLTKVLF